MLEVKICQDTFHCTWTLCGRIPYRLFRKTYVKYIGIESIFACTTKNLLGILITYFVAALFYKEQSLMHPRSIKIHEFKTARISLGSARPLFYFLHLISTFKTEFKRFDIQTKHHFLRSLFNCVSIRIVSYRHANLIDISRTFNSHPREA